MESAGPIQSIEREAPTAPWVVLAAAAFRSSSSPLHPYSLERRRLATSQSIAAELGIGAATVLTYRQRAYERLEISQASAMLDRLLD